MRIPIVSPKHGRFEFLIDKEDWKKVKSRQIYVHKTGRYFYIWVNSPKIALQRLLMQPIPKGMVVDHINRDTLDNRRRNLRVVTIRDNLRNQRRSDNKTGFTGVSLGYKGKYEASIKLNYRKIYLGLFDTVEKAYEARKKAEQKYWA